MTTYDRLAEIAATHTEHLRGYATDLTIHDRKTLATAAPGSQWIWLLREHGTELFPVAGGLDPVWATYWLDAGNSSRAPTLAYHVTLGANAREVMPITSDRARTLANLPHPQGKRVTISLIGPRADKAA